MVCSEDVRVLKSPGGNPVRPCCINSLMQKLSDEENEALKARHKKERDKRICDRIKAVLLFNEGWSYQQIADIF